jgi:hypothetical protein
MKASNYWPLYFIVPQGLSVLIVFLIIVVFHGLFSRFLHFDSWLMYSSLSNRLSRLEITHNSLQMTSIDCFSQKTVPRIVSPFILWRCVILLVFLLFALNSRELLRRHFFSHTNRLWIIILRCLMLLFHCLVRSKSVGFEMIRSSQHALLFHPISRHFGSCIYQNRVNMTFNNIFTFNHVCLSFLVRYFMYVCAGWEFSLFWSS